MMSKSAHFLVMAATCVLLGSGLQGFAVGSVPVLHGMAAEAGSDGPVVHLQATGSLDTVHYSPQPGVWIVEMPEAMWDEGTGVLSVPQLGVERAELSRVEEFGKTISRLTIWLTEAAQLELESRADGLDLVFSSLGAAASAARGAATTETEPLVESEGIPVPRVGSTEPVAATAEALAAETTAEPAEPAEEGRPPAAVPDAAFSEVPPPEVAASGLAASPAISLLEVTPVRSGDGVMIELRGDGVLHGHAFALPDPERIVVDLPGVVNRVENHLYAVNSPLVRRVRVAQFRATPEPITRIVVDLERGAEHQVTGTASGALIAVGVEGGALSGVASVPPVVAVAAMSSDEDVGYDQLSASTQPVSGEGDSVTDSDVDAGAVETAGEPVSAVAAATPSLSYDSQGTPVVSNGQPTQDNSVPPSVTYDSSSGAPVVSNNPEPVEISNVRRGPEQGTLISNDTGRLVITRGEPAPGSEPEVPDSVKQYQHQQYQPDADENAAIAVEQTYQEPEPGRRSPWVADPSQLIERAPAAQMMKTQSSGTAEQFEPTEVETEEKKYTGDPISLTLKDADIRDVLRTFATLTNLNIVQDDVSGSVTVDLKNVPWDQALDLILKVNNLGYVLENNVLRVAPLNKLQTERQAAIEMAAGQESTQPIRTVVQPLSYAKAATVARLLEGEAFLLSPRGSVVVDDRTNTLIIRDSGDRVEGILRLIDTLDLPATQVVVEGRIVETTRDFSNEFGLSWGFTGMMDAEHNSQTGLTFPNEVTVDGAVNLSRGNINGVIGFSFVDLMDTFNLDFILSAAESEGLVKIVSTPRVTTQNLRQASVQSGLQIPVQMQVNNTVTVQYISATLKLQVTPQITAEGTVILDLNIQKQEPQLALGVAGATGVPIFTRDAQTQLLVRDGGTTVIAGIYTINDQSSNQGVPVLSKIPVVGYLFKNRGAFKRHDELLIFITPRIVKY